MPITHLMSEICNLAYLIVENIVEEQYPRRHSRAAEEQRRKKKQRPHRPHGTYKKVAQSPDPFLRSRNS
jgi:hypothetical protein